MKPLDTRNSCRFCKVTTWMKDYSAFMRDHDRADGRHCVRASKDQAQAKSCPHPWFESGCSICVPV